jgi:Polyketide cyclase / dehydrase and lipid transport
MDVDFANVIVIARSPTDVADYAANPDNAPKWYGSIKAVEWKTTPPVRAGSQINFVAQFLGTRMAYTYQVVEYVRRQRLVMRTITGLFPVETIYTWEAVGPHSTRMTLRHRGMAPGVLKLIARPIGHAMRNTNRADLANLKRLLEGGTQA